LASQADDNDAAQHNSRMVSAWRVALESVRNVAASAFAIGGLSLSKS
jgi:hypothetical protein